VDDGRQRIDALTGHQPDGVQRKWQREVDGRARSGIVLSWSEEDYKYTIYQ
jgi:hypothetical protein